MDSANFLTLAGRLARDAVARGVVHQDTAHAFIEEANRLTRLGSGTVWEPSESVAFREETVTMWDTTQPPTIDDVKQARANAFAHRMKEGTD